MFGRTKARRTREFQPAVSSLESRVVLSSFKFPAAVGPAVTLNYSGNEVLTSRTYEKVMHSIDRTLKAFANEYARAFQRTGGDFNKLDVLLGSVNATGASGYSKGLLGKIDRIMMKAESMIPYGMGRHPSVTGGVGLSERTALTSTTNDYGQSVASLLDDAVSSSGGLTSVRDVRAAIEQIRREVLAQSARGNPFHTNPNGEPQGILASYISAFGPGGARAFGLRNR